MKLALNENLHEMLHLRDWMCVRAVTLTIHEEIGVVKCINNYKRPSATSLGLRYFSAGIRSIKTEI